MQEDLGVAVTLIRRMLVADDDIVDILKSFAGYEEPDGQG